ncbi:MAG: allophanate hydrolase subunit 1 [Hamadaea sp.]|nr:allophanate hydrolase subunit 1 [Hamadaea sp.]
MGFSLRLRSTAVVTPPGYDTVGYWTVGCERLHHEEVTISDPVVRPVGRNGLLIEVDDPTAWYAALHRARERGDLRCAEIVPAARTVLVDGVTDVPLARALIADTVPLPASTDAGTMDIAVTWDGEDYAEVAERWGRDPADVLRTTPFTVAFCGFAPGFGYLTGLPAELHLPRRETPRPSVPAGSVATAGPYVGVYPRRTPGGWQLLGHTDAVLFDPDRVPPGLLAPGVAVRFSDA